MLSRHARPIRTLHVDDLVVLVAKCLSAFTHFVTVCQKKTKKVNVTSYDAAPMNEAGPLDTGRPIPILSPKP